MLKAYPVVRPCTMKEQGLRRIVVISLVFCALALSGCATPEDLGRLEYDVAYLKSDVKDLKKKTEGERLESRVQGLEEAREATGKSVSDLYLEVQSLKGEMQGINSKVEEIRYASDATAKEKSALVVQVQGLETRVAELDRKLSSSAMVKTREEEQKPAGEMEREKDIRKTGEEAKPAETTTEDIKNVYMEAYRLFKEEKFTEARERFEAFLRDYPENEYSDNSRLWLGEIYFKEKNYEDAILAYEDLLKKNPESEKVPSALLKQGMAFYELKDPGTARIIFEKIVQDFPDSEQAQIARKKLGPPPEKKGKKR